MIGHHHTLEDRWHRDGCAALITEHLLLTSANLPEWWEPNGNRLFSTEGAPIPEIVLHDPNQIVTGCTIIIDRAAVLPLIILWGANCTVYIGDAAFFPDSMLACGDGAAVLIGPNCRCVGRAHINARNDGEIIVEGDSLWSTDILVMTDDMHAIRDVATGKRLNPFGGRVVIENHVWLGIQAAVRGNARIGHDSIVGAKSFVARDIPPNSIAVGTPAKVTRSGVTWSPEDCP